MYVCIMHVLGLLLLLLLLYLSVFMIKTAYVPMHIALFLNGWLTG